MKGQDVRIPATRDRHSDTSSPIMSFKSAGWTRKNVQGDLHQTPNHRNTSHARRARPGADYENRNHDAMIAEASSRPPTAAASYGPRRPCPAMRLRFSKSFARRQGHHHAKLIESAGSHWPTARHAPCVAAENYTGFVAKTAATTKADSAMRGWNRAIAPVKVIKDVHHHARHSTGNTAPYTRGGINSPPGAGIDGPGRLVAAACVVRA